jgi:hypothetical protein
VSWQAAAAAEVVAAVSDSAAAGGVLLVPDCRQLQLVAAAVEFLARCVTG